MENKMIGFSAFACALAIGAGCLPIAVCAEEATPKQIYRTSVSGNTESNTTDRYNISYVATLEAYSDGLIHLEVRTVTASAVSKNRAIGSFSFDDTYIWRLNESSTQKSTEITHDSCKTTYSFDDNGIVYTLSTLDTRSFTYAADLYVREPYIESSVPFQFFGKNIEIPFGAEEIPSGDAELQELIKNLQTEKEALAKQKSELDAKVSTLESQNKDLSESVQSYKTELEALKTQNLALASSIMKYETENGTLKTQLAAFDSNGDGLLNVKDAQILLTYYTASLVGDTTGRLEDYPAYVEQYKGE